MRPFSAAAPAPAPAPAPTATASGGSSSRVIQQQQYAYEAATDASSSISEARGSSWMRVPGSGTGLKSRRGGVAVAAAAAAAAGAPSECGATAMRLYSPGSVDSAAGYSKDWDTAGDIVSPSGYSSSGWRRGSGRQRLSGVRGGRGGAPRLFATAVWMATSLLALALLLTHAIGYVNGATPQLLHWPAPSFQLTSNTSWLPFLAVLAVTVAGAALMAVCLAKLHALWLHAAAPRQAVLVHMAAVAGYTGLCALCCAVCCLLQVDSVEWVYRPRWRQAHALQLRTQAHAAAVAVAIVAMLVHMVAVTILYAIDDSLPTRLRDRSRDERSSPSNSNSSSGSTSGSGSPQHALQLLPRGQIVANRMSLALRLAPSLSLILLPVLAAVSPWSAPHHRLLLIASAMEHAAAAAAAAFTLLYVRDFYLLLATKRN